MSVCGELGKAMSHRTGSREVHTSRNLCQYNNNTTHKHSLLIYNKYNHNNNKDKDNLLQLISVLQCHTLCHHPKQPPQQPHQCQYQYSTIYLHRHIRCLSIQHLLRRLYHSSCRSSSRRILRRLSSHRLVCIKLNRKHSTHPHNPPVPNNTSPPQPYSAIIHQVTHHKISKNQATVLQITQHHQAITTTIILLHQTQHHQDMVLQIIQHHQVITTILLTLHRWDMVIIIVDMIHLMIMITIKILYQKERDHYNIRLNY